jgi:hypothetical protein
MERTESSSEVDNRRSEKWLIIIYTEIGGLKDEGFKVGLEPAERELGAPGSHWAEERSNSVE